jgi:Na+-transporting NADH:ubiquinone oxidoreductase subunit NqrC
VGCAAIELHDEIHRQHRPTLTVVVVVVVALVAIAVPVVAAVALCIHVLQATNASRRHDRMASKIRNVSSRALTNDELFEIKNFANPIEKQIELNLPVIAFRL